MKDRLMGLLARWMVKLVRALAGMPDARLARLLSALERLLRLLGGRGEDLVALIELKELAQSDPEGMTLLRNLVLESRDGQILAMLGGTLKHHAFGKPPGKDLGALQPAVRGRGRLLRLGIAGDHYDLDLLRRAYRTLDRCQDVAVPAGDAAESESALERVNGLEISSPSLATREFVHRSLSRGMAVSLHYTCFHGPEELQPVLQAAGRNGRERLRIFHPVLYYPPVVRLKSLLDQGRLGEVCSIRIRATLGGAGSRRPAEVPHPERYLDHPAFDQFLLMTFLGGCVEKVTAYLNPMNPERGGQGLVNCKFACPGRYGLLECAYAPGLYVPSDHFPHDLEVEVAGTDGVAWLTRGMGTRTQSAPLRVRVGRKAFSIGVESGLESDWSSAYSSAAGEMLRMVAPGGVRPLLAPEEGLSAYRLRERAYEASRRREVLAV